MSPRAQNVLMVAFHFPPIAAAGTHRTLNFARLLSQRGCRVAVLTTSSIAGQAEDLGLLARVPERVRVVRAGHFDPYLVLARLRGRRDAGTAAAVMPAGDGAAPGRRAGLLQTGLDYASRLFMIPDRYVSWVAPAVLRGVLLGRQVAAGVLYSTAPPYSAHVVGLLLSRILGIPLVADFRDPWTLNPFHANPYASQRRLDAACEEAVLRGAARVILNTVQAEALYRTRYPELDKFCTINNGIDPDLLERPPAPRAGNGSLRLVHIGAIYGRRYPAGLVRALARLKASDAALFARVLVEQIGPVDEGPRLAGELQELGLGGHFVVSGPVAHAEAFRRCQAADGLLLLGPSGRQPEVQVPSKLFEYLAAGRPILALARRDGAIATVLEQARAPCLLADPDDPEAILAGLRRFPAAGGRAAAVERFGYEHLTSLLERELEQALGRSDRGASVAPAQEE